ncbi:MAG: hypothetical protein K8R23_03750 [Chthoniobacter sp.]|nr:hypothetical protein [Chthoniobacter sp.]
MKPTSILPFLLATTLAATAMPPSSEAPANDQRHARRHEPRPQKMRPPRGPARFGDPLPGLSKVQMDAFTTGLDEFTNVEDVAGGLGPIFNNVSCVSCHNAPAVGGASRETVTRFGHATGGVFDPLADLGGSLLQARAIDPDAIERVPPEANVTALRQTTPIFGLGLIEAIPDEAIKRLAAQPQRDGIAGRAARVTDVVSGEERVGRFGYKAQQATLLAFSADAYRNEMGITNRFFPTENAPNGDSAKLAKWDQIADPEDEVDASGRSDIDVVADYMRLLGAPPQAPFSPTAQNGFNVFRQLACDACHTPVQMTGRSEIAALNFKPVPLFSDLLLHDMGALGDGIAQSDAGPRDMRTSPLWGLRASAPYLHDGRAPNVDAAIRAHDGEAAKSRDRYLRLHQLQRRQLLEFLNSI